MCLNMAAKSIIPPCFISIARNRFSWADCKNFRVSRSIIWLCRFQRLFYSPHHLISFSQTEAIGLPPLFQNMTIHSFFICYRHEELNEELMNPFIIYNVGKTQAKLSKSPGKNLKSRKFWSLLVQCRLHLGIPWDEDLKHVRWLASWTS